MLPTISVVSNEPNQSPPTLFFSSSSLMAFYFIWKNDVGDYGPLDFIDRVYSCLAIVSNGAGTVLIRAKAHALWRGLWLRRRARRSVTAESADEVDDRGNGGFGCFGSFGCACRNFVAVAVVGPKCGGVSAWFRSVGQKGIVADTKIIVADGQKHCRK